LFRIQLISQATGVWVHLHDAAHSAGVHFPPGWRCPAL